MHLSAPLLYLAKAVQAKIQYGVPLSCLDANGLFYRPLMESSCVMASRSSICEGDMYTTLETPTLPAAYWRITTNVCHTD